MYSIMALCGVIAWQVCTRHGDLCTCVCGRVSCVCVRAEGCNAATDKDWPRPSNYRLFQLNKLIQMKLILPS